MNTPFLPRISKEKIEELQAAGAVEALYDELAQPLHEELYRRGTFDFFDVLSPIQQLLLGYDYVRTQAGQGGFIQLIHNGYIGLLPDMVAQLKLVSAGDMAQVLDDVLKVYVLNREQLAKPTDVQEFARLYDEFREFEMIDERFNELNARTMDLVLRFATSHMDQCAELI